MGGERGQEGNTPLTLSGARDISFSRCEGYKKASTAIFLINPALASNRRRSPHKKHFKETMAAKGVFCFVLISALAALATSLPWEGRSKPQPLCDCINPFVGTRNAYRGDSESLCGSGGPGFCHVPCDADCSDIQPTSTASRCQSVNACDVQGGIKLLAAPGKYIKTQRRCDTVILILKPLSVSEIK